MRDFPNPPGIDFREVRTTDPLNVAKAHEHSDSQFGVERNQLNDDTIPDLATKARMDLVNKAQVQRNG